MRTATPHRRTGLLLACAAAALLAVAGCGSSSSSDTASRQSLSGAAKDAAAQPGAPANGYAEQKPGPGQPVRANADKYATPPLKVAPRERSIVRKGELTVRVKNVKNAAEDAVKLADRLDGYVAGDNRARRADDTTASLVLRVPGKSFDEAIRGAAQLGEEVERDFSTEDVTEAVVDIEARIASQRASVERVRTLLSRAERITDLAQVEGELARRESDLASLEAQQRSLAGTVEYSTITLHLAGPNSPVTKEHEDATFFSALANGWHALLAVGNGVLIAFGAALPFLLAFGVPAALVLWALRRRRLAAGPPAPPAEEPA